MWISMFSKALKCVSNFPSIEHCLLFGLRLLPCPCACMHIQEGNYFVEAMHHACTLDRSIFDMRHASQVDWVLIPLFHRLFFSFCSLMRWLVGSYLSTVQYICFNIDRNNGVRHIQDSSCGNQYWTCAIRSTSKVWGKWTIWNYFLTDQNIVNFTKQMHCGARHAQIIDNIVLFPYLQLSTAIIKASRKLQKSVAELGTSTSILSIACADWAEVCEVVICFARNMTRISSTVVELIWFLLVTSDRFDISCI